MEAKEGYRKVQLKTYFLFCKVPPHIQEQFGRFFSQEAASNFEFWKAPKVQIISEQSPIRTLKRERSTKV